MKILNPRNVALELLNQFGIDDPKDISVLDIIYALDIPIKFAPLSNCDGRIIHGSKKSMIVINDSVTFQTRRNFTIAHELGHYLLHKNNGIQHFDNMNTMSWFDKENQNIIAKQEFEANTFASELLLPTDIFIEEVKGKKFSPQLIRSIADKYSVSRSSVIYRFTENGNHPICVFYTKDNKVKYWRRSSDFKYRIKECTKIPPPIDSVSAEYFDDGTIYSVKDAVQEIVKSTWLEVKEDFIEDVFYEFCMVYSEANLAISVIWED